MKQIRGVIFDLDGTLIDSMWVWEAIDQEFLGRYGYEVPEGLGRAIEGMSFTETAQYFDSHFELPLSVDEIKTCWNEMAYEKYCHEVMLKKGVKSFLERLAGQNIPMGIATSNSRNLVEQVIANRGIAGYFSSIATACEVKAGKPAPDIYRKVAEDLGVEPKYCLVFEDVPAGILAGKAAGMQVCAVEDTFSRDLKEEKIRLADYYITDYDELESGRGGHPLAGVLDMQ